MPGTKRKVDEDTWIISQSKKFKTGVSLSSVYETTLAHLRVGARNFFTSLIGSSPGASPTRSNSPPEAASPVPGPSSRNGGNGGSTSPHHHTSYSPPGSPLVRDLISDNELQSPTTSLVVMRPTVICQDCVIRSGRTVGTEESYGKCSYCDKLACHLNSCRGCGYNFCGGCSIAKYDDSSADTFECYSCLH